MRVANFAPFLAEHGIALRFHPTLTDAGYRTLSSPAPIWHKVGALAAGVRRAAEGGDAHDLLLVHRLRLLSPFPGLDPPRHLDVYDLDDALFLGSPAEVNRSFQWAKQEARRSIACLRRARLVVAGNAFLADRSRAYAGRVEVVPSCVDPARQALHTHREAEVATVGWIGSHTTSAYLEPILPVFAAINHDRPRARLVVVGGDTGIRAGWIEHRPWSLAGEADDLASFDVGIMPLPDTDWARGKCGYKVLQYFSAGVPAVASPVGVTPELIGTERGILASSPEEWRRAIERLIADVQERRERGTAARSFVEQNYSYQRWAPELAALLKSVVAV